MGLIVPTHDWFGTTLVIMYGPTPGGGVFERSTIAVPAGTKPDEGNARMFSNGPYGASRWTVIVRVALFALMPEIEVAAPVENALAPTIVVV
jgi:hypothetical protein